MLIITIKANTDAEGAIEVVESITPAVMREGLRSSQGAYWEVSVEGTSAGGDEGDPYREPPPPDDSRQPDLFQFAEGAAAPDAGARPNH